VVGNVRWVVKDGEGASVGEIVARAGGDARAIEEGRVFVGKKRATRTDAPVSAGDEVLISSSRGDADRDAVRVLLDRDDVVAVEKVAGIPTIPDHAGAGHSLIAETARALGVAVTTLHATSRLDRDVSGVVVFARSKRARDRLTQARETHAYVRRYVALASATPRGDASGAWDDSIGRAKDARHRAIDGVDAAVARTRYAVIARAAVGTTALLALSPETGRTHQIRVHAAHAGAALLGDRTYGGPTRMTLPSGRVLALARIFLHCARVTIPVARGTATVDAPIPGELTETWRALSDDALAWERAVAAKV
jgi:23S rRNA pseudouridine1911/1915/1917 synthase